MRKYLILLASLIILLVGCDTTKTGKDVVVPGSPFIGGEKGLIAEFLPMGVFDEKTNIEEIFDTESFPLEVSLKNKGEAMIEAGNASIILSGVDITQFNPTIPSSKPNTQKLDAVSEFNPQGGEETVSFGGPFTYKLPLVGSSLDLNFFAKIEYNYSTRSSVPKVCLKGNLNDPSVCNVDEVKDVYSSAGPIQVKSAVEKSAGTGKVSVELGIQNIGSGDSTTQLGTFDYRFDKVGFSVNDPVKWDCKSGGSPTEARLDTEGKALIICKLITALKTEELYTQELGLTLKYKYREIIHKQLRIKKSS